LAKLNCFITFKIKSIFQAWMMESYKNDDGCFEWLKKKTDVEESSLEKNPIADLFNDFEKANRLIFEHCGQIMEGTPQIAPLSAFQVVSILEQRNLRPWEQAGSCIEEIAVLQRKYLASKTEELLAIKERKNEENTLWFQNWISRVDSSEGGIFQWLKNNNDDDNEFLNLVAELEKEFDLASEIIPLSASQLASILKEKNIVPKRNIVTFTKVVANLLRDYLKSERERLSQMEEHKQQQELQRQEQLEEEQREKQEQQRREQLEKEQREQMEKEQREQQEKEQREQQEQRREQLEKEQREQMEKEQREQMEKQQREQMEKQQQKLCKLKNQASRSRKQLIDEISQAGDSVAKPVDSDGVVVAFPIYKVAKDASKGLSYFTYSKIIFRGQENFFQSLDSLNLDGEKYVFLCAVVAVNDETKANTIMPYFVKPVMDMYEAKSTELKTVVLNAKSFSPSSEVSLYLSIFSTRFLIRSPVAS